MTKNEYGKFACEAAARYVNNTQEKHHPVLPTDFTVDHEWHGNLFSDIWVIRKDCPFTFYLVSFEHKKPDVYTLQVYKESAYRTLCV